MLISGTAYAAIPQVRAIVIGTATTTTTFTSNLTCYSCHKALLPDLKRVSVHQPFAKQSCTVCHIKHSSGTTPSGLVLPVEQLCLKCHPVTAQTMRAVHTHAPFASGGCLDCHDPHGSDHAALLVQAPADLCVSCHSMSVELGRTWTHDPAAQHQCTLCHDAHGSAYQGVLRSSQKELCAGCHPMVAASAQMGFQHQPFLDNECTSCHEPHGATAAGLLVTSQSELCYRCHTDTMPLGGSTHQMGSAGARCGTCHSPHASNYPALVPDGDNGICFACHNGEESLAWFEGSKHSAQPCWSCHEVHNAPADPLLGADATTICLTCHDPMDFGDESVGGQNNHPVGSSYIDVNTGGPLTCVSTCHTPHGNANRYLLKQYTYPMDGNCLICHGVLPGETVGVDF